MWSLIRWILAALTLAVVSYVAEKNPRLGAFILTLPVLSILAIILQWQQTQDLGTTSRFARETLVLVPLGLPFFVPLAFAERLGISFWPAISCGFLLASITIGAWLMIGPK
jgi:predicted ABC-type exoprotein transport system permease subunit